MALFLDLRMPPTIPLIYLKLLWALFISKWLYTFSYCNACRLSIWCMQLKFKTFFSLFGVRFLAEFLKPELFRFEAYSTFRGFNIFGTLRERVVPCFRKFGG